MSTAIEGVAAPLASDGDFADDLIRYIAASPTPYHAAAMASQRLAALGFQSLELSEDFGLRLTAQAGARGSEAGGRFYVPVNSGDGTLIAFAIPEGLFGRPKAVRGFRIVGAHTDSPNLRLKPRPVYEKAGYLQLGVEVYGGALLNSWLDRDLYLAGRAVVRGADGRLLPRLVTLPRRLLRIPQLAIHLDRDINEKGLVLNRQEHLPPIVGLSSPGRGPVVPGDPGFLHALCADALAVSPESIVTVELMLADAVPPTRGGLDNELVFAPRLDNLAMCHAALLALQQAVLAQEGDDGIIPVIALFDHEEVGSASAYGAHGPSLPAVLERIVLGLGGSRADYLQVLAGSLCVSADMAHAVHPNYADRHEPQHRPHLNGGPVIKVNSQQRYATCARTAAWFQELCKQEGVPVQHYAHRTDLPCGSTIGPITSTLLGIPTIDVGNPMLSMHSVRELCGAADPGLMIRVLSRFLR